MTKIINNDLILTKNGIYNESIIVNGHIRGKDGKRFNLKVNGSISAWDIKAWDIKARNISAWDIRARDILARDIKARDISARDISAHNILAWDISALDILARDIKARNILAWDILARDITAWDILANNILYYAVCFAYKNIKCRKIEGSRIKSRHFALDGKIEIVKEGE